MLIIIFIIFFGFFPEFYSYYKLWNLYKKIKDFIYLNIIKVLMMIFYSNKYINP